MHQVFISYARADYKDEHGNVLVNSIVSDVKQALTKAGIDFWIDEEGLSSGVQFASMIGYAIVNCDALIFISTDASNRSEWTARELALANDYKKPIIPLKCDDSPYSLRFAMYLATIQYIDCRYDRSAAMHTLVRDIKDVFDGTYDPDGSNSPSDGESMFSVLKQHDFLSAASTLFASFFFFYFGTLVLTDPQMPDSVQSAMQFIAAIAYLLVSFLLMLAGYGAWLLFRADQLGYWFLALSFPAVLVAAQDMDDYFFWLISYIVALILLARGLVANSGGHRFCDHIRPHRFSIRRYWGLFILLVFFCVYAVMKLRF